MSDVSALIGKLKANVAYRRFAAPNAESGASWPVLERIAKAQREGDGQAETASEASVPQVEAAPLQPAAPVEAPPQPAHASPLLRRVQGQAAPIVAALTPRQPAPPTFSALASAAEPLMSAAPEQILPPQPPLQPEGDTAQPAPAPEPAKGLLLQRYAPSPAPAPEPAADPSALSGIFARLERKIR